MSHCSCSSIGIITLWALTFLLWPVRGLVSECTKNPLPPPNSIDGKIELDRLEIGRCYEMPEGTFPVVRASQYVCSSVEQLCTWDLKWTAGFLEADPGGKSAHEKLLWSRNVTRLSMQGPTFI